MFDGDAFLIENKITMLDQSLQCHEIFIENSRHVERSNRKQLQ